MPDERFKKMEQEKAARRKAVEAEAERIRKAEQAKKKGS